METQIILLNSDYTFLNIVSCKKAIKLIIKGKVEIIKKSKDFIKGTKLKIIKPYIIKLVNFISLHRVRIPYSKKNVFIRDGNKCVYCGSNYKLTIDHVVPKSKGGKTNFLNCVTACYSCNNKKGSKKTNIEIEPYQPTIGQFLTLKTQELKIDWSIK